MMSLVVGTEPFFNRHDANKTMVSLYLNDIKYAGVTTTFSRPSMPFSRRRTLLMGTECGIATVSYKRSENVRGNMKVFQGRTLTLSMLSTLRRCIGLPIEW